MAGIPEVRPYLLPAAAELPQNVADWTISADRVVLLVHDMQRYFLRPFRESCDPYLGLMANARALRERCAGLGVPVAYTAQPGMTAADRGLLKDFWGPGMRVDPEDRRIVDDLAPQPDDWIYTKWRYSAFYQSGLLQDMRACGRDQLLLCGVYAHVGVLMTAVEGFTNDIECFLAADAVADFNGTHHAMALDYAAGRCAVVGTTARFVHELQDNATATSWPATLRHESSRS